MKDKSKELLLLIVPVLILIVFGASKYREEEIEKARFKPFVQAITCEHLSRTKDGRQTARIEILISHQGTTPAWWGKSVKVGLKVVQFHVPRKNTWFVRVSHARINFDARRRQYIVAFQRIGGGSQLFSLYRGTLRGKLTLKAAGSSEAATFKFNRAFDNIKGRPAPNVRKRPDSGRTKRRTQPPTAPLVPRSTSGFRRRVSLVVQ